MSKNTIYPQEAAAYVALFAAVGFASIGPGGYSDSNDKVEEVQENVENTVENDETTVVNEIHYDEKTVNRIKLDSTDEYSTDYSCFKPMTIEEAYEQILLEENPVTDQELIASFNSETEKYGVIIKSYSESQNLLVLDSNRISMDRIRKVTMDDQKWFEKFNSLLNTLKVKKLFVSENVLLDCSNLDTSSLSELFLGDFDEDTLDWIEDDSPILDKLTLYHSDDLCITVDLYSRTVKNIQIIGNDKYSNVNLGDIDVKYEVEEEAKDTTISFCNTKITVGTYFKNLNVGRVNFEDSEFSYVNSRHFSEFEDIPFFVKSKSSSISYDPNKDDFDDVIERIYDISYYSDEDKKYDYSNLNDLLIKKFNDQFKNFGVEIIYDVQDLENNSVALTLSVIDSNSSVFKIRSDRFYDEFNELIKYLCVNNLKITNSNAIDLARIDIDGVTEMNIDNPNESVYKWIYQKKPRLDILRLNYYDENNQPINVYSSSIKKLYISNYTENDIELGNVYFTYYDEKDEYGTGNLVIYKIAITENTEIRFFGKDCVFKYYYYGNDIEHPEKLANIADFVSYSFTTGEEYNGKILTK